MCSYKKIIETRSFVKNNQLFLTVLEAGKAKMKALLDQLVTHGREGRLCLTLGKVEGKSVEPCVTSSHSQGWSRLA
jgi:hypothetical protein